MSTTEVPVMAQRALTAQDRCDRCGAQAYVLTQVGGSELLFCAHHFKEHEPKLTALLATILTDERSALKGG